MSGLTPYYGLAYFTFGDNLGDGINVQREINRFLLIDKQLFGLYSVFGNGAISGWDVSSSNNFGANTISVSVSPGVGIINSLAVQTSTNIQISDLPSNDSFDIYAVLTSGTVRSRDVKFIWSRTLPGLNAIRIARVTTSDTSVSNIDSTFREEIGFLEFIKDEVAKHKHRGTPSKIDLQIETKNQLPGSRVEDFDAAKIVSGRINPARIPQIDHNSLANKGLITHAGLDSFAKLITSGNRELLGEVSSVNIMKLITSQYYIADNLNMNLSDIIDFPNLLICYPGITPNTILDIEASTANINVSSNCISGKPVQQGAITSVIWDTTQSFNTATFKQNVTIARNSVSLTRGGGSSSSVETFDKVSRAGVPIPGFGISVQITSDTIAVNSDDTQKTEGFYSAKFTTERDYRILYTKTVSQNNDWSIYDELLLDVKSLSINHGAVYMYFVNGSGESAEKSQDYLILGPGEITDNIDPSFDGFERRSFDISDAVKDNITQIVFYTDDASTNHVFWVDNIFLRNQSLFPPSGIARYRYSGGSSVLFSAINYDASIPDGCDLRIRVRSANSSSLLSRSVFTKNLRSGDVFSLQGTDAEIEVVLVSNEERNLTPTLTKIELQIIVDSEITGFTISSADQWSKGSFVNTKYSEDEYNRFVQKITIEEPISVGDLYYSYQNGISQNDPNGVPVAGFKGVLFKDLLSPSQAINISSEQYSPGFSKPFSVYRLKNKRFIIADTDNDRVIETLPNGEFYRGIGSHLVSDGENFYPLTSVYNPRKGVITVCFSQEIDSAKIDLTKMKLWIGNAGILFGNNDEILDNGKNAKILEILLSDDKAQQLENPLFSVSVSFSEGFLPTSFVYPTSAKLLLGPRGLPVFIGDFVYSDDIRRPVFANILENGNFIIGNSSIKQDDSEGASDYLLTVVVGDSKKFTIQADTAPAGASTRWEVDIPQKIQSIVTFSTKNSAREMELSVNSPTSEEVRDWKIFITIAYVNTSTGETISTTKKTLVLKIQNTETQTPENENDVPSVVEINFENETVHFNLDAIKFSDFTLGSVFEIDDEKFLISGLVANSESLPFSEDTSSFETYEEQAKRKLSGYSGKTIIISRLDGSITFEYNAADNAYPSDAIVDSSGSVVIAETSFVGNSGRVIKLDDYGNIVWQIGGNLFSKINDVRSSLNGDIIVST